MSKSVLDKFWKAIESKGYDRNKFLTEKDKDYRIVAFNETGEPGIIYNIYLIFYNSKSEDVEVVVKKLIEELPSIDVLEKVNQLNQQYLGVTFLFEKEDNTIVAKSLVETEGDVNKIMTRMVSTMRAAQTEFKAFKAR